MQIRMAYGEDGLDVDVPDDAVVVRPRHAAPVADLAARLSTALREPIGGGPALRDRVAAGSSVAISMCDLTRPQPREPMIRALLDELDGLVSDSDITVLVATGTHRANTDAEIHRMLGGLEDRVRVLNHDARDRESLTWCGELGAGVPVWLNRFWTGADVRITTGFVEPHFFAGFSGGPKLVAPGLAGLDTTLVLHDASRIGSPRATWGVTEGNPVHDDVRAIASGTGVTYALDVVLDDEQRVTAAFGGDVLAMHAAASDYVRATAMVPVSDRFDIVVTSNSGFPLDQNLYQSVKGLAAAETVVREGGLIVAVAECRDGLPDHGSFRDELCAAPDPRGLLAGIAARTRTVADQWQAQVLARVLVRARVALHTDGLTDLDLHRAHLSPSPDPSTTIALECERIDRVTGRTASVCILPEGPQTIPFVLTPPDVCAATP